MVRNTCIGGVAVALSRYGSEKPASAIRRQRLAEPAVQRPLQRKLRQPAQQGTAYGGREPQDAELAQVVSKQAGLGNTECAQHRDLGRLLPGRVACGDRDCGHRDHQRQHDRQGEEIARAIERPAHFRARVFEILDFLVGLQPGPEPGLEPGDLALVAGEHDAILYPATRNHEPGGRQIAEIHQHPRREIEYRAAAVRLVGQ